VFTKTGVFSLSTSAKAYRCAINKFLHVTWILPNAMPVKAKPLHVEIKFMEQKPVHSHVRLSVGVIPFVVPIVQMGVKPSATVSLVLAKLLVLCV